MVITISRQFATGGHTIAQRVAEKLGIAFYDKELVNRVAEQSGFDVDFVTRQGEYIGSKSLLFDIVTRNRASYEDPTDKLFRIQKQIILELGAKEDCVIVGRGANKILEEEEPFNIFIYADMESKMARCRERAPEDENLTDKELARKIRQVDAARAKTQEMISDFKWGDKKWYHLCVNTSGLPIPETAALVAEYAKHWFERKERYQ